MQSNYISKIMNMERLDISQAIYGLLQHLQPASSSVERSFFMLQKLLVKDQSLRSKIELDYFTFQFLHLVIAELAAYIKHASYKFC